MATVFRPGSVAAVVSDLGTGHPVLRPARVHECDANSRCVVISQTTPPLGPGDGRGLHLTGVVQSADGEGIRLGTSAVIVEAIPAYRLPRGQSEPAVRLRLGGRLRPMNMRTAYRLRPHERIRMELTLMRGSEQFRSGEHLILYDLSIGGVGFVIPRRSGGMRNPLLDIAVGDEMRMDLTVAVVGDDAPTCIQCDLQVVQVNPAYNQVSAYAGIRMASLERDAELRLSRFVARAQLACRRPDASRSGDRAGSR